jgi:GntR family transcriptional regulator
MASRGTSSVGFALAKVLRDRIAGGRYTNNFPTENELMAEFAMSRYAVRSALQRLETDGQIRRHPGRGTMLVERFSEGSTWAIRTVEDLIDRNLTQRSIVLSAEAVPARLYPDFGQLFGLGAREKIFLIERLAKPAETAAPFFSLTFMPVAVGRALPRRRIAVEPLIVQIERIRRIRAHRVRQDIAGGSAGGRVAEQLKVEPGHPTVVIRRTYFGWDGEVIVVGELHYRLDGFRQTIDLFRENLPAP